MRFSEIKKSLSKTYDDLADYWGNDKTLHNWGEDDLEKFVKVLGKGAKVLDLGCASGYQSKLLFGLGLDVTGLDLSKRMIQAAKRRVPKATFMVGDMTKMGFKSKIFNGVYSRAAILHVPKNLVPKVLKSVYRILKDKGVFYLALKEGGFEGHVDDERHGMKVNRFFSYFKEAEIKKLLVGAGFEVSSVTYHQRPGGSTKWLKIFAKKV